MLHLPSQIELGFRPISVVRVNRDPADTDEGGYYHSGHRELFVATDTPTHEQALAALHEIVHMLIDERDLEMPLETEEAVCNAVSRGLAEMLLKNPNLIPRIVEALK